VDVEHRLEAVSPDPPQQFRTRVKVATSALGDVTGGDPQANLKLLAAKLMELNDGLCAFGGIEAVFILRTDGLWEENHAVHFGTGGWTGSGFGKYIGSHRDKDAPQACGAPTPPPASEIHVKRFGGRPNAPKFDAVGRVKGLEYCTTVGFTNRQKCPVRPEPCDRPECVWKDRAECELLVFGTPAWRSDGTVHETANKNPWQRHVTDGTWVQVCTGPEIVEQVCSNLLYY
jgi:hypothetical protein